MSTPIWIGDDAALSFGWYHAATGDQREVGVVLCNPLGYEAMCTHRTYRLLAERLASEGFPVVRFDYHGTGDSAGTETDPGRVNAWQESIAAAIDALQRHSGLEKVVLFGLRFGGTLALAAAGAMADVVAVIAWAPLVSGKAYVRELSAFNLLKGDSAAAHRHIEAAGFLLTSETVDELQRVDLLSLAKPTASHILLLRRDAASSEGRLAKHLGVECELVAGYEPMMRDPHEAVVPAGVIERIAQWLHEIFPQRTAPGLGSPPSLHDHPIGEAREQPLFFGPDSQLFGILTTGPRWLQTRPLVLLLNTGSNHHVGSHRMSVTLARRLASAGFASFRFDIAGLGDSALTGDARGKRHYAPDAVADVQAAIALLTAAVGSERFVVVGLCSGAYLGFNSTLQIPNVVGQVLMNLQPTILTTVEPSSLLTYKSNRHYKARLFEMATYRRLLGGEINVRGVGGAIARRLWRRLSNRVRATVQRGPERLPRNLVEGGFFALAERGVRSLVVFSADDGAIDQLAELMGDRMARWLSHPLVRYEVIDGADHTFTKIEPRSRLIDLVLGYLSEHFP